MKTKDVMGDAGMLRKSARVWNPAFLGDMLHLAVDGRPPRGIQFENYYCVAAFNTIAVAAMQI